MTVSDEQPILPEDDDPDRLALELASMCDMVESGAARVMSATFPRLTDASDLATLARSIAAGRGLVADVEVGPDAVTVHIRRHLATEPTHG